MEALWLKYTHLLGASILFGTGLGTAFQMWAAHRGGSVPVIAAVARNVVRADWLFTAPAVLLQPVTGLLLAASLGYALDSAWILAAVGLYLVAGACWLPVVWLQHRMARLARFAAADGRDLPPRFHRYWRLWVWLGWPAFGAVLVIYHLMIFRPEMTLP